MQHLRLTRPGLDFWVDVRLRVWDGNWLAVADFADEPDVGTGADLGGLMALGPRFARGTADGAPPEDPEESRW